MSNLKPVYRLTFFVFLHCLSQLFGKLLRNLKNDLLNEIHHLLEKYQIHMIYRSNPSISVSYNLLFFRTYSLRYSSSDLSTHHPSSLPCYIFLDHLLCSKLRLILIWSYFFIVSNLTFPSFSTFDYFPLYTISSSFIYFCVIIKYF